MVQEKRAKALREDTAHYSRCATVGGSLNSSEPVFSSPVRGGGEGYVRSQVSGHP